MVMEVSEDVGLRMLNIELTSVVLTRTFPINEGEPPTTVFGSSDRLRVTHNCEGSDAVS